MLKDQVRVSYGLGRAQDNTEMEAFNSRFKTEDRSLLLDVQSLTELKQLVAERMVNYNTVRRHSSIGYRTPSKFIATLQPWVHPHHNSKMQGKLRVGYTETVRRSPNVTIQDVAKESGVSATTVSRVIRGNDAVIRISPATRERVLDACQKLEYRPNAFARALRTNRSGLIGVIVRDVSDPFQSLLVKAIDHSAASANYRFLVSHIETSPKEGEYSEILESHNADGVIIVGDIVGDEMSLRQLLIRCPFLVATGHPQVPGVRRVVVDNRGGVRALIEHLCSLGHRDIAMAWDDRVWDMRERHDEFMALVSERNLVQCPDRFARVPSSFTGGQLALNGLLGCATMPTALVLANDVMALGALHAARSRGIRIPQDLSITGFDDIPLASFVDPEITTVRQPIMEIGDTAVRLLVEWIEQGASPIADVRILPVSLVVRQSTSVPAARKE